MRSTPWVLLATLGLLLLPCRSSSAQEAPAGPAAAAPAEPPAAPPAATAATMADIQCGPPTWRLPTCATCTEGGKTYVYTKFVEAAIAKLHESLKGLTDPLAEVQAMTLLLGEPHVQSKQWQEQGEKSPEITATYCWKPVKAEAIKPLADKRYGLGSYYDGHCKVDADSCYHFTMDCRKQRNEKEYICNPSLQEFRAKDGKCVDSPRAHACDCQPSVYWKCGPGGGKAGAAAKAGRPAKGRGKR